jgi:hypothetical protein
MTLKTIEDLSQFIGGYVSGSNQMIVNLDDGTMLDFTETVNDLFRVVFSNGKVFELKIENERVENRLLKLRGKFE